MNACSQTHAASPRPSCALARGSQATPVLDRCNARRKVRWDGPRPAELEVISHQDDSSEEATARSQAASHQPDEAGSDAPRRQLQQQQQYHQQQQARHQPQQSQTQPRSLSGRMPSSQQASLDQQHKNRSSTSGNERQSRRSAQTSPSRRGEPQRGGVDRAAASFSSPSSSSDDFWNEGPSTGPSLTSRDFPRNGNRQYDDAPGSRGRHPSGRPMSEQPQSSSSSRHRAPQEDQPGSTGVSDDDDFLQNGPSMRPMYQRNTPGQAGRFQNDRVQSSRATGSGRSLSEQPQGNGYQSDSASGRGMSQQTQRPGPQGQRAYGQGRSEQSDDRGFQRGRGSQEERPSKWVKGERVRDWASDGERPPRRREGGADRRGADFGQQQAGRGQRGRSNLRQSFFGEESFEQMGASPESIAALADLGITRPSHIQVP